LALLAVSPTQVNLQWTENNPNTEEGYRIYRAPQVGGVAGTYALIFTTAPNVSAYADTTAAAGTTYYYRVAAFSGSLISASAEASPVTTPGLPVLSASAPTSTSVNLTWGDVSYEDTYMLERSTNGTTWTTIAASLAQNTTSYGDTVPVAGTYYYRLTAQGALGNFASNTAIVTTIILPANSPLLSLVSASTSSITISWIDNAAAETNFRVYYRTVGSGVWTIATLTIPPSPGTGGTVNYTRAGTYITGRNYEFRVAAVVGGALYYSNIITFAIP
jgi:titin